MVPFHSAPRSLKLIYVSYAFYKLISVFGDESDDNLCQIPRNISNVNSKGLYSTMMQLNSSKCRFMNIIEENATRVF